MKKSIWGFCSALVFFLTSAAFAGGLSEGLLLHYPFDRDEGPVLTDASGSGRFGWTHGATWVADGAKGGGCRFDSNRQYIVADDAGLPSGDAPRTMALWIKLDQLNPDPVTALLTYGRGSWNHMSGIGMDWRVGRANLYFTQCGGVALSQWRMEKPGSWHHLAYVYEGKGLHRFYVDGRPGNGMSELRGVIDTQLSGAVIVGADPTGTGPVGGVLDDVRIYGRALSEKEIAELVAPEKPAGPIVHYTFDRDEGGIVTDDSGNGRTAKVDGATWVKAGARGGAVRFDSNSETITATDAGLPSGDAPRSIALWMKIDREYDEGCTGMLGYGTDNFNRQFSGLGFDWRLDRDRVYFSPGGACFLTERKLPEPGTWIHIAYTYGGNGDHHLYFDGVPSDGMSELWGPVGTLLSGQLRMGGHPGNPGPDGGYLDDVRIYGRVLSAEEIAALAVPDPTPEPQDLLVHYTFDKDEGALVTDDSGNGRTAQVDGATWVKDGARGGAYRFDHNGQSIRATDAGLPSGDAPRSIALWMKIDTNHLEGCTGMLGYGTDGFDYRFNGIGFDWRLDRDRVYFTPGGACFLTDRQLPEPGTWIHVAYTYGGNGDHHLYFDGVPSDGMSELWGPVNTTLSGLLLLGGHPNGEGPAGGYLDDVRIYGRVLSEKEIAELAVRSPGGSEPGEEIGNVEPNLNEEIEFQMIGNGDGVAGTMTIQWACEPGVAYDLYWTDDLTQGFTLIASGLVSDGAEISYTNALAGARTGFYRVAIHQ